MTSKQLDRRLAAVKILLCDVDGVLTDATVSVGGPLEIKRFNVRDGIGLRLLMAEGIRVAWVSARRSTATTRRARELGIDFLHQQERDKGPGAKTRAVEGVLTRAGFDWNEACYVGDDIVDLGSLARAHVAVAVANAIPEVKARAHFVTRAAGGGGAVREVVERLLKARGRWATILSEYAA